jgi:hypothetical protein
MLVQTEAPMHINVYRIQVCKADDHKLDMGTQGPVVRETVRVRERQAGTAHGAGKLDTNLNMMIAARSHWLLQIEYTAAVCAG